MARKPDVGQLRNDAATALERGKLDKAIELYGEFEAAEPAAPAWPKKIGEIHRRNGNQTAAVAAFERAAEKYALAGFLVQAIAVCKLILQIDPEHSATQARLSALMPKPISRPETPKQLRAETAPLVYDDESDEPVREATPRFTRAETAPATPTARTSTRDPDRAVDELASRDAPAIPVPQARTSTRELDVVAAAARVRDDKAALREVLRQRDEATTRDPRSEPPPIPPPRVPRPQTARDPLAESQPIPRPGAPSVREARESREDATAARRRDEVIAARNPDEATRNRDEAAEPSLRDLRRDEATARVRDDKTALREVLRQRDEDSTGQSRAIPRAASEPGSDDAPSRPTPRPEPRVDSAQSRPIPRVGSESDDARPVPQSRPALRPPSEPRPDVAPPSRPAAEPDPRSVPQSRPIPRLPSEPSAGVVPQSRPLPRLPSEPSAGVAPPSRPTPRPASEPDPRSPPQSRPLPRLPSEPSAGVAPQSRPTPWPASEPDPRSPPQSRPLPRLPSEPSAGAVPPSRPTPRPASEPDPRSPPQSRPLPRLPTEPSAGAVPQSRPIPRLPSEPSDSRGAAVPPTRPTPRPNERDAAARLRELRDEALRSADAAARATPADDNPPLDDNAPRAPHRLQPRAQTTPATPAATRAATDRPAPPRPVPDDHRRAREPSLPVMIVDRPMSVDIPPGGGLDQIDLSTLIPGSVHIMRDDGMYSGVNLLPLGEDDDLELSLDDAELVTDRTPGPAARRALLTTPLFPQVSPRVLEQLIGDMSLLELAPDEILFREGEPGNEMYVISEGTVAVETKDAGELARLGPSAFFGEIALVTDLPRSATIRAITQVELLVIDRAVIREASKKFPETISVLLRFVRDRLIDRITRTSELFAPFTEPERQALSAKFELVEVVPDAILITQGERADGLYLVVAGTVEVWRDGESAIATLGSGDVFGELSLLQGGGSTANVRATTRVLALRMPASTFKEVIMTHPQVLAYLGELAERRTPRAEDEEFVDLHLDLLV